MVEVGEEGWRAANRVDATCYFAMTDDEQREFFRKILSSYEGYREIALFYF